jgi:Cu+-exporting ATPase
MVDASQGAGTLAAPPPDRAVELRVGGMTCASCAARVERTLNKIDGVTATVNYATERASVSAPPELDTGELIATVRAAGYTASPVRARWAPSADPADALHPSEVSSPGGSTHPGRGPTGTPTTSTPDTGTRPAGTASAGSEGSAASAVADSSRPAPELAGSGLADPGSAESPDRPDPAGSASRPAVRLLVAAALSVPVVALAMVPALRVAHWQWISLALTTPVVAWCGWPFHRAAAVNLRHGAATMDTLISLGTLAAYGWSLAVLLDGTSSGISGDMAGMTGMSGDMAGMSGGELYLEVAAAVTTFILAGRYLEARAKRRAGAALRALLALGAKDVAVLPGDDPDSPDGAAAERRVPIERLRVGTLFVIRPGERIATDGQVLRGGSAVDASLITGEPVPVEVGPGDAVTGGCLNTTGRLVVRADQVGADTQLARIASLVERAQAGKAAAQRLADRVSAVFVPAVVVLALLTLAGWLLAGAGANQAFTSAVAVLIIACPCALGLATPTALLVGTGRGAQLGILVRGPQVLESTRRVDTVVLDKTGTLTTGRMTLVEVHPAEGEDPAEVLRLAAAAEHGSAHPIAAAVGSGARERLGGWPAASAFRSVDGLGVRAEVAGREVLVGRPALLAEAGAPLTGELARELAAAEATGHTAVAVAWGGQPRGLLLVADQVKPTAAAAVTELRGLGLHPVLLTGDNAAAAGAVAAEVGIDEVIAGVLPTGKAAEIDRLRAQGRVVAMVGDGVNDAAALASAELGIAMGTGADAAIEAGDLTVVRGDPLLVADAIRLARRTLAVIKGNLCWAFGYNLAALPLAAAGLLNPMIAGAAMALSSVFVVTNSLRLRHFR